MSDLNAAIQERVTRTSPAYLAGAVLAVADLCEQMRTTQGAIYRDDAADQFEQTIARALGIPTT
jgi:hypothetical protein